MTSQPAESGRRGCDGPQELRLALAVEASVDGFWGWCPAENAAWYSPRWQQICGFEAQEHIAGSDHWLERVHSEDKPMVVADLRALQTGRAQRLKREHRVRHQDGSYRWVLARGVAERNAEGQVSRIAGSLTDTTERRMADPLTGLPNRLFFLDRLERRMELGRSQGDWNFAVVTLALDRFAMVNENLGYAGGDALLIETADRLREVVTAPSFAARLNGAEFLLCLEKAGSFEQADRLAQEIHEELHRPFRWRNSRMTPGVFFGFARADAAYAHPEELMRDAESALIQARAGAQGNVVSYSSGMRERALERLRLEADLERAISAGELVLFYQPEYDLASGRIIGFEALVRWNHPQRGVIAPADFIPLAEETGLILPLGHWGLAEACRQIVAWRELTVGRRADRDVDLRVSVNLSAKQFSSQDLVERVQEILHQTSIPAGDLRLEVTETSLMGDAESALKTMQGLQSLGVGLHMDDFGVGYSSLHHLHRFPFDTLKIDRSFIGRISEEKGGEEIVRTILDMARSLRMKVVAEGIETAGQAEQLRAMGCPFGQGYYFAKPMTAGAVSEMLVAGA
jgi:diguanylate cyclase (GGDEF)-like protein/PAS domain S-box-containing protein